MDLNLTAEELTFRDELRAWLVSNVPKDWSDWREKPMEESFSYLRAWQRKLQEGRWAAVSWPKEYGGRSASLMQQAIFWEEMARVEAPVSYTHLLYKRLLSDCHRSISRDLAMRTTLLTLDR